MKPLLFHIQPINPQTGLRVDVRLGSGDTPAYNGMGGHNWESAVIRRPVFMQDLMSPDLDGSIQTARGSFAINLSRILGLAAGVLAASLNWSGAPITVYDASSFDPANMPVEFNGIVRGQSLDIFAQTVGLDLEVDISRLERPMLRLDFGGGGGADGDPEKRNVLKPMGMGVCPNVEPVWFDEVNNVGMVDGYGNLVSVEGMFEGRSPLGDSFGDYATYDLLVAAPIPNGRWATCLDEGMVRLGAPPVGVITADITCGVDRPGAMMRRAIENQAQVDVADVDTASFAALDVAVPRGVHFWTATQREVLDFIQAVAASCNATALVLLNGKISVTRAFGGVNIGTLNRNGTSQPAYTDWKVADYPDPVWRLRARAERPGRVLDYSEVNYVDDLIDMGAYDAGDTYRQGNLVWAPSGAQYLFINEMPTAGQPLPVPPATSTAYWQQTRPPTGAADLVYADGQSIESLKPAEAGADVTGNNTAADSLALGGVDAALLLSDLDGKSTIFYQDAQPTIAESEINDRWVDRDDGNLEYRRVGASLDLGGFIPVLGGFRPSMPWARADDQRIGNSIIAAATAQATADSKIRTFFTYTAAELAPVPEDQGDLWVKRHLTPVEIWAANASLVWERASTVGAPDDAPVGSLTGAQVAAATTNFNARNDRLATAVTAPTVAGDGTAIDHTANTDGSVDLSFEWSWGGTEAHIDGFLIAVVARTASGAYVFGTSPEIESVFTVPASKRAIIFPGSPADNYYTIGVQAYRTVDPDIAAAGVLLSTIVKSAAAGENPYRPSASVAFAGNVTGTIDGDSAVAVANGAAYALLGLNPDGTVGTNKVTAASMSADTINKIVSASAANVTSTDGGAVLLTLSNVAAKPSQGGYVHLLLTCELELTVGATSAKTSAILYARLQRSAAGAGVWTEIQSWRMGSTNCPTYDDDDGTVVIEKSIKVFVLRVSAAQQFINVPPSDGNWDYRWLVSKTNDGTGSTAPEVGAGIARNAYGLALSVKVAN